MTRTEDSLADIQAFLGSAIPRTAALSQDPRVSAAATKLVAPGLRLTPVEQVEIYREQFWLRHIGAMTEDFVTVRHVLGDDGFRLVCERYFAARPPQSFTLRDLGDGFAEFLRETEPWSKDALLEDCARLEWAFVEAFDAPDASPLNPETIASASEDAWATANVIFHPSVQLVELSYPVHVFRKDVKENVDGVVASAPERPTAGPTWVVVYRGPERLMYIAIERLAFQLLKRLARGEALAAACESVASEAGSAEASSELEAKVGSWFQAWASYGWVSEVLFRPDPSSSQGPPSCRPTITPLERG
jgi:hypothetical protein